MTRPMTPSTRADRMYTAVIVGLGATFVAYAGGPVWSLVAGAAVALVAVAWELSQPWRDARHVRRHGDLPRKRIPGLLPRLAVYAGVLAFVIGVAWMGAGTEDLDTTVWVFGLFVLCLFAISGLELQFLRRRNRARAMGPQPVR